ncbi:MAG: cyclic pyranopterin monophosphate synthase MoaC [Myxococcales bacterium]|nr:cyclic pyranopterin monophosphate synthase MoaC [Polyangiaceae bacterium]MDW8248319.1 cyclic pyranopterin monophosphate synthase MoaC [Myxococcales bacterium]
MSAIPPLLFAFEQTEDLALLPLAARRALDLAGQKLSLAGWQSLLRGERMALIEAGASEQVPVVQVRAIVARANPPPTPVEACPDPPIDEVLPVLSGLLGPGRVLSLHRWASLRALDRYAFRHLAHPERQEQLQALFDECCKIPAPTHLDEKGEARMIGVASKAPTLRRAVASARVVMEPAVLSQISEQGAPKGDAFGVARIAGIQGAKRTHELIPLCHALHLTRVDVRFELSPEPGVVRIVATVEAVDRTGVEMEAMTGASVAALALYDMIKGMQRDVEIGPILLEEKEGGRTGPWRRSSL